MKQSSWLYSAGVCAGLTLLQPSLLWAAVDDEIEGEQMYSISGIPEAARSFWDPGVWRDKTAPIESPVVPTDTHWLYFGRKSFEGVPFAEPARDFTLYTAAHSGFTPPAVTPQFSRVWLSDDEIVFNGTPDVPGAPLGKFAIAAPHPLQMLGTSDVDFDRTIVDVTNVMLSAGSALKITGEVTSAGNTYNFRNTGLTSFSRTSASIKPTMLIRNGAIVQLAACQTSSAADPLFPAQTAPTFRLQNAANLSISSLQVFESVDSIIAATDGSGTVTIGSLQVSSTTAHADPLVVFDGGGSASPLPLPSFSVTNMSTLNGFNGILAHMADGATMNFQNLIGITGTGGRMGLRAESNGAINMTNIDSVTALPANGSTSLDWQASTGGTISLSQVMGAALHLDGSTSQIVASSGGKIDIPSELAFDTAGRLVLSANGAGSELRIDGTSQYAPYNYLSNPAARWDRFTMNLSAGALLRGGETVDFGGGTFYPDKRTVYVHDTILSSQLTVSNASIKNATLTFSNASPEISIGAIGAPATLNHVDIYTGDTALMIVRGGVWQPERIETNSQSQLLQVGDASGGSLATFTNAAVAHSLDLRVGNGVFVDPGDPVPTVNNSYLSINHGSTVTGSLGAALLPNGKGVVTITGTGTTAGFRNVQLGVASNPMIQNTGGGPPSFNGRFFSTLAGQSSMNVTSGARVSIGSFERAFAEWQQPDGFTPAYLSANSAPITIDATSAIYLGSAANAAGRDFRNGALVVGPGGYMIGSGTILGDAVGGNDLVNAGGTISPGFSPGRWEVDGNFVMESGTLILEVRDNGVGGWDVIDADSITITGGTVIFKPTPDFDSGAGFSVDFFQTSNLTISPGVVIQIDPVLAGASFSVTTGSLTVIGGAENDLNFNGLDDRLEAVLPLVGGRLEMPVLHPPVATIPVFTFRRNDESLFGHTIVVQWSTDLVQWNDIAIPYSTFDNVTIVSNDDQPDSISVSLPPLAPGQTRVFARLTVMKQTGLPF